MIIFDAFTSIKNNAFYCTEISNFSMLDNIKRYTTPKRDDLVIWYVV